jgi:hypothetical protein
MPTLNNHAFELWWRQTGEALFLNFDYQSQEQVSADAAKLVAQEAWEMAMGNLQELKESYEKDLAAAQGDGYGEGYSDGEAQAYDQGFNDGYEKGQQDAPTPTEK